MATAWFGNSNRIIVCRGLLVLGVGYAKVLGGALTWCSSENVHVKKLGGLGTGCNFATLAFDVFFVFYVEQVCLVVHSVLLVGYRNMEAT